MQTQPTLLAALTHKDRISNSTMTTKASSSKTLLSFANLKSPPNASPLNTLSIGSDNEDLMTPKARSSKALLSFEDAMTPRASSCKAFSRFQDTSPASSGSGSMASNASCSPCFTNTPQNQGAGPCNPWCSPTALRGNLVEEPPSKMYGKTLLKSEREPLPAAKAWLAALR